MIISITPESFDERDRGNGPETQPRAKPGGNPEYSPNHLTLEGGGTSAPLGLGGGRIYRNKVK